MKNLLIIVCLISLISCERKTKLEYKITATCDRIIVQDTVDNYVAHFLVSFTNTNKRDVLIFANSCRDGYQSNNYEQTGIYLKKNNIETPLGQFNKSVFFRVKAGKSFKILYTYNELYPNKKINFDTGKDLETKFMNIDLFYKSNNVIINKLIGERQYNKDDLISEIPYFKVDMSKAVIEFKENLNIEDAIKLVDGKIIK